MIVADLIKIEELELLTNIDLNIEIVDIYAGDLLSFVMGKVKEENVLFLTIINSMNVIAVASLLNMSAVIFCDGVTPSKEVIEKALEENVILFKTKLSSIKIAKVIYESLL